MQSYLNSFFISITFTSIGYYFSRKRNDINKILKFFGNAHNPLSHQHRMLSRLQLFLSSKLRRKPKEQNMLLKSQKLPLQVPYQLNESFNRFNLLCHSAAAGNAVITLVKTFSVCASLTLLQHHPLSSTRSRSQPLVAVETLCLSVELRTYPLSLLNREAFVLVAW